MTCKISYLFSVSKERGISCDIYVHVCLYVSLQELGLGVYIVCSVCILVEVFQCVSQYFPFASVVGQLEAVKEPVSEALSLLGVGY